MKKTIVLVLVMTIVVFFGKASFSENIVEMDDTADSELQVLMKKCEESLEDLSVFASGNLLPEKDTDTAGGITYTRIERGHYIANGTATGLGMFRFFNSVDQLPDGFVPGKTYLLKYFTDSELITARIYAYDAEENETRITSLWTKSQYFTIPENTVGISIRFQTNTLQSFVNVHVEMAIYDADSISGQVAANYEWKPRPMLSIVDDDGNVKHYLQLLPLIEETGAPITTAITTLRTDLREATDALRKAEADYAAGQITQEELQNFQADYDGVWEELGLDPKEYGENWGQRFMSWSEIEEVFERGGEVVSHTYGHFSPEHELALSEEQLIRQYRMSKNRLAKHGIPCEILIYNGMTGAYAKIRNCTKYAFSYGFRSNGEVLNTIETNPYNIRRWGVSDWSLDTLTGWIDQLTTVSSGWMVWTIHTSNYDWSEENVEILREVIHYAQSKNIPIVTLATGTRAYFEQKSMAGITFKDDN